MQEDHFAQPRAQNRFYVQKEAVEQAARHQAEREKRFEELLRAYEAQQIFAEDRRELAVVKVQEDKKQKCVLAP